MGKARITREARQELDQIWAFIARDSGSIDTAERVLGEIISAINQLAKMPGMGARRDELVAGIRSYPVYRYLIFYREVPGGIQVVHVLQGARNLRRFFRKK
jgi:toxin ParE1/3/4